MRVLWFLLLGTPVLYLTSCQTGDVKARVPITGGQELDVVLTPAGPKPGEADGYSVRVATIMPGKGPREAVYQFALVSKNPPDLTRIQVEDVTDDVIAPLIDEKSPKFMHNLWGAQTDPIGADDPRMKWIETITVSFRAYRFTLTHQDGKKTSFYHVAAYPPFLKELIRNKWVTK